MQGLDRCLRGSCNRMNLMAIETEDDLMGSEEICEKIGDSMKDKEYEVALTEQEAYEWYLDRISAPSKPRRLTPEEIEKLKKQGRI